MVQTKLHTAYLPHADTDWAYMLDEVETCFVRLATEIASRQPLLLVAPEFPAAWPTSPIVTRLLL